MQTNFTLAQLADPETARSEQILRKCVHCGFCTATCPTFVLLGDERDSPRGRIYFIKAMLEGNRAPTASEVRHIDRCLSCLSCMTTCPSGVHYMHLVDHGRHHIENTYRRVLSDRLLRRLLGFLMPRPQFLRWVTVLTWFAKPLAAVLPADSGDPGGATFWRRVKAMIEAVPSRVPVPSAVDRPQTFAAEGSRRQRVALMPGCGQQVLAPEVNEATVRLLTRHGIEVVNVAGSGCCGSSVQHIGDNAQALELAKRNIVAWLKEADGQGLDAVVINASGCGTTVKDYGCMFEHDPLWRDRARRVAALAKDISELMVEVGLANVTPRPLTVAYHSACSMQHGQKVIEQPMKLLRDAGFHVKEVPEGHLCCGWAGTYQILQPELSRRLRDRKVVNIESLQPDVIAAGNFGCVGNIASGTGIPVVHTVELLDWATGGPKPAAMT
ncbi:heterodisulfide reductase-related iron-sulfur binding cluster [Enhydrobacter sp.]|uniref:heterodisulfide reductase-related iron-sulfur binding cluster n=1 Tax=Enhydrobacter sp. TaxID=1894999 RepID=UPI0026337D5E|nr:heterodisulfide reductase-related iron-sulfur binding cluster [Enhydrobacter sp.]WIM13202.1 MAG: Glycolate dehydrogenase, iron-sulfur subunit GlcF [Enhydrobacter sp.]